MRYHPIMEKISRRELAARFEKENGLTRKDAKEQVALIPSDQFQNSIHQALAKVREKHGEQLELPTHFLITPENPVGAIGDGHLIQEFLAWLKTPQGQMFLEVLKAIIGALIAALLAGS